MAEQGIRVTIEDLEAGTTETRTFWNDYMLITAGDRYEDSVQAYGNGTHVITVKRRAAPPAGAGTVPATEPAEGGESHG